MTVDRLPELLARWQDDELDAGEYEEFVELLGAPRARAEFAQELMDVETIRGALAEIRAAQAVDEVRSAETVDEAGPLHSPKAQPRPVRILRLRASRRSFGVPLAVAAGLAAAATVVIAVLLDSPQRRPAEHGRVAEGPRSSGASIDENAAPEPLLAEPRVGEGRGPEVAARDEAPEDRPSVAVPQAEDAPAPVSVPVTPLPATNVARSPEPKEDASSGAIHVAYLDEIEGRVEISAGGDAWRPAKRGAALASGGRIRTRLARARVVFESGTLLLVNRFTTLTVVSREKAPLVDIAGGEVFVAIAPDDAGFCVATPHGRAVDLGTRFGVDADVKRTVVVVTEGSVSASTDAGTAELTAGQEVALVGKGARPGTVRPARDLERRLAWTKTMSPALSAAPAPPVPEGPAVVSFTLIDADTDRPVRQFDPLSDGAVVDLARLRAKRISIRANTVPREVGSVRFELDGDRAFNVESIAPYTLNTDTDGNCEPWKSPLGLHALTAVPYSQAKGRGKAGKPLTIRFRIIDGRKVR